MKGVKEDAPPPRVGLMTHGCLLARLYARCFPEDFDAEGHTPVLFVERERTLDAGGPISESRPGVSERLSCYPVTR